MVVAQITIRVSARTEAPAFGKLAVGNASYGFADERRGEKLHNFFQVLDEIDCRRMFHVSGERLRLLRQRD